MPLADSDIDAVLDYCGFAVPPEDRPLFRDAARGMRTMCARVRALAAETTESETLELFSIVWPHGEERP